MLRRIIILCICVIWCVQNSANFPQSVRIVVFSVNFHIVVSIVKEAKNVKWSDAFQCLPNNDVRNCSAVAQYCLTPILALMS
jgi:hypothetical protein